MCRLETRTSVQPSCGVALGTGDVTDDLQLFSVLLTLIFNADSVSAIGEVGLVVADTVHLR